MKFIANVDYYENIAKQTGTHHTDLTGWINDNLNRYGQWEIKTLDDIKPGEKYAVFIDGAKHTDYWLPNTYFSWDVWGLNSKNTGEVVDHYIMSDRMKQDSQQGLVHWVIAYPYEGHAEDKFDFEKMAKGFHCRSEHVTYVTNAVSHIENLNTKLKATVSKTGMNLLYNNVNKLQPIDYEKPESWEHRHMIQDKIEQIYYKKPTDFRALMYSRVPRPHRAIIVSHTLYKNYQDKVAFSYYEPQRAQLGQYHDSFSYLHATFEKLLHMDNIIMPDEKDYYDKVVADRDWWGALNFNHALMSSMHIVTETYFNNHANISEKSYQPFAFLQPFISCAGHQTVAYMKHLGYNVFEKWINHDYDSIEDPIDRMHAFLKEYDRLMSLDQHVVSHMLYDCLDSILANLDRLMVPEPITTPNQFTKNMMEFFSA